MYGWVSLRRAARELQDGFPSYTTDVEQCIVRRFRFRCRVWGLLGAWPQSDKTFPDSSRLWVANQCSFFEISSGDSSAATCLAIGVL